MPRSGSPELILQEIWAYLTVNYCLSRLAEQIADQRDIDPDGLSLTKLLKQARRSVIRQAATTLAKAVDAAHAIPQDRRRYRNRIAPGRSAPRTLKRQPSRYRLRASEREQPVTTRVPTKKITLRPALGQ